MNPLRMVRRELLAYNAFKASKGELLEQLNQMDNDIRPRLSFLDGLPRGHGGLAKSIVEYTAMDREETKESLNKQLELIEQRINPVEAALTILSPIEKEVIKLTFFSLEYDHDSEISEVLGLSLRRMEEIQNQAMWTIYHVLSLSMHSSKQIV